MKLISVLITTCTLWACIEAQSDLVVHIEEGAIRGTTLTSLRNNRTFYAFLGIPYAEPPIGKLRFKAPQPIRPWTKIRDATEEGNVCPQILPESNEFVGNENCLNLNVYTILNETLKPVLVWFHQGAFLWRSARRKVAAPDFFMEEDVIFVSTNSRLGPQGYLSLQTKEVPGNAAFKDQVLSLKWVQRNIQHFGGDPSKVTIVGESAGGNIVHLLMLSPMSKGQKTTASQLEHHTDDPTIRIPFCPTIDKESPRGEVFFSDTPFNLLSKGLFHKVPFLVGSNSADAIKYEDGKIEL
ncbi:hypothetical protein C0J52_24737 [Blattella germanica]|nr:hypothetical protein C0J52_24737 [Blattella germanica]